MGKLADRLRDIMNRGIRPIGFAAATASAQPPMLLVAAVSALGDEAAAACEAGAGAVLAAQKDVSKDAEGDTAKKLDKTLLGAQVTDTDKAAIEGLAKTGAAFAVLTDTAAPAAALSAEGIDLVLTVDPEWTDTIARGVGELPIEAVIYQPQTMGPLSIYDQLACTRIIGLSRKPVIVVLPEAWGVAALSPLHEAGVMGIVVPSAEVAAYAEALRTLPLKKKSREEISVMLPGSSSHNEHEHDEGDEEDRATGTTPVDGD